jgi:hypothetical protein
MAGFYRPRHPERTVLYRVLFHHFDRFLTEYESRFEREYFFFRPIVKEAVERYLDCGNPHCGFACIRSPDCGEERLLLDVRQLFAAIDIAARPKVYYQRG